MFSKKNEIPLLTYFTLKVNISALNDWVTNPSKIKPMSEYEWGNIETREYEITILPIEKFTFYHKKTNEFSPSIGGLDILDNNNIGCIEWSWNKSHFNVNVDHPRKSVFNVPLDEIFHLLKTGSNLSQNALKDREVISLDSDELFDEIYRDRTSHFALFYSNELVSLQVICPNADDLVNYN